MIKLLLILMAFKKLITVLIFLGRRSIDSSSSQQSWTACFNDPLQGWVRCLRRLGFTRRRRSFLDTLPKHRFRLANNRASCRITFGWVHGRHETNRRNVIITLKKRSLFIKIIIFIYS